MMKIKNILLSMAAAFTLLLNAGCSDFLDQKTETILTDDQIFGDEVMIRSLMANFYARITWGQYPANYGVIHYLDEAAYCNGDPDQMQVFSSDLWRVYDYTLIRNINQALAGVQATTALSEANRRSLEAELRYIRAWVYFNMARCLGGVPIVGDEVFEYNSPDDVPAMQMARSTEAEIYDYIIKECTEAASILSAATNAHSARANKWVALMLKARAAIYAGSLANYNNKMANPIRTTGGEVGIPADRANGYYQTALAAATEVINGGVYTLQNGNSDLGQNFYEAVSVKDGNTEVIWARDYIYPGTTHGFSSHLVAPSHAEDIDMGQECPILNIVEAFEYKDNRNGEIKIRNGSDYVFYDDPADAFANKDARLWGSVIYPNATYKGIPAPIQAGQKIYANGSYTTLTSVRGERDDAGRVITAANGPTTTNEQYVSKTGFYFRKYMDETTGAATRGRGSEMWFPYFRIAEAYLIASEASMELGSQADAVRYINAVRRRAGIQDLTAVTLDDIVRENQVEFAFEGHRYYDLKRWRIAHEIWNGVQGDPHAQHWVLFPYLVVGGPNDGKYVFDKFQATCTTYPRYFQFSNYYNFIADAWVNNNPKMVRNPYQN